MENSGFGRFKTINRIEFPKSDMHYDVAVNKIKELNELYQPFAIYCDRGAGEYQIEMLRKALGEKVKGVHLGSSYEVRDPISRVLEKKPLKPFLVNQTTLMLERGQIRIPHKSIDETLHRQMTNYQVVKVSANTGVPVYNDTDEHSLDAMEFALLAFIDNFPDLVNSIFKPKMATKMNKVSVITKDPLRQLSYDNFDSSDGNKPKHSSRLKRANIGSSQKTSNWGKRSIGKSNSRSSF